MASIPNRKTVVSYAYTVKNNNGKAIGTLQTLTIAMNRQLQRIFEINRNASTVDTFEIVPGRSDYSISINRLETYENSLWEALGISNADEVSKATSPINITEILIGPNGETRTTEYHNCWIASIGKTIQEGTITVSENVSLQVEYIVVA
jgi:hypothetical protein